MTTLHIDFETRSAADLTVVGLDNYARDPSTDVWCMAWAIGDDEVSLWTPDQPLDGNVIAAVQCGYTVAVQCGYTVVAQNAAFELAIWNNIMVPRYGWPELKPEQVECTQAMAYAMAIPASLERAAAAMGIKQQKDMAGHRLMLQMCRPKDIHKSLDGNKKLDIYDWHDDPDKLARLYAYCKQDVEVERELYKRLMPLSKKERRVWQLDYRINRRGIPVDLEAVKAAAEIVTHEQERLNLAIRAATDDAVGFTTEVARITKWVRAQGVDIDGLAKADVLDALSDESLPESVRRVLEIRKEAGRSSTAKLNSILATAGQDGRVRGVFQYHGAGTGRWAGRVLQPHNLPRPSLKPQEVEAAIELLKSGEINKLNLLFGQPMSVASDCLRGMIAAPEGYDLMAGDFANIEGRMLAWLAGEEWKLQAFRAFDAKTGPDLYLVTAAKIYHTTPDAYTKESPQRQVGKTAELAYGFGGGVGAFRTMEKGLHLDLGLSDEQVNQAKDEWRAAHPAIVQYWADLEAAAINAVCNAGMLFTAGPKGREVKYKKVGSFLWCGLPSGRAICYPYPKILPVETPWGATKDALTYMKVIAKTEAIKEKIIPDTAAQGDWQRVSTFGGKLSENVTQACARDVLADAMLRLDEFGFQIVLHVHDEVVVMERGALLVEVFKSLMSEVPAWAAGLPVAIETWMAKRYRK